VNLSRLAYRPRQFWNALLSYAKHIPEEALLPYLTAVQLDLFRRMQPAEQAHAYRIFKRLETAGQTAPDLLAAALLHDVGKTLSRLSIFDRVLIVLGSRLFPDAAQRWAAGSGRGLRRPFVVAEQHAEWGAGLASQAGADPRTVELIRHHHDRLLPDPVPEDHRNLAALQAADNEN
jgi:putative nucleotidyltransferase with HDIG domain